MKLMYQYLKEIIEKDIFYSDGKYLKENHALEILLSYSKDGIIWSIPNDVYTHVNNFPKSNFSYIVSTEKIN